MGEEDEKAQVSVDPPPADPPAAVEEKPDDSKALVVVEKAAEPPPKEKSVAKSLDRDIALAQVETEKKMSLIKAWEESEKTKAENKSQKKLSAICSWENTKKADLEAQLKKMESDKRGYLIEDASKCGTTLLLDFDDSSCSIKYGEGETLRTFDVQRVLRTCVNLRVVGNNCSKLYEQEKLENKKAEYAEKMKNKVAMIHKEAEEKRAMVEATRGEELLKTEETAAKFRAKGEPPKKGCACFSA